LLPWSSLKGFVAPNGDVNFDAIKQQIAGLLQNTFGDGTVGDAVNQLWDELSNTSSQGGLTFTFPIITQPADVAIGLLLGQDKDMVTVADTIHLPEDESFPIKIIPGFSVRVIATATFDASFQIGYDTRGLAKR